MNDLTGRFGLDEDWDWKAIARQLEQEKDRRALDELKTTVSIEEARDLFAALAALDDPVDIARLRDLGQQQTAWGGGFHGMLPEPLPESEIPVPADLPGIVRCAAFLASARQANLAALRDVIPSYPVSFMGTSLEDAMPGAARPVPAGWSLELDLDGIDAVLSLFERGTVSQEEANTVAALPAFVEMMRHRRELGYIPEPLITKDGLASFLMHAASRTPLDMLWKWLTPENLFDLADLFMTKNQYRLLLETIESHRHEIASHILGAIARFAPAGTVFDDRLTFAVGWGIAGWATAATGGINIEHFKDDYGRLLLTLTHETFHRFQLHVCPSDPDNASDQRSFETIASFPFALDLDRKFYEALTYIFLEGTATFVAAAHPPADPDASIRQGEELLAEVFSALYRDRNIDRAEEILNSGLKSNGPFYWLGARIAKSIVENGGDEALAAALADGAPAFFALGLARDTSVSFPAQAEIVAKARELAEMMRGT